MALESPFYGMRRPAYQSGSKLHRVSDLLALGRATIEESLSLLNWAQVNGFERLGKTITCWLGHGYAEHGANTILLLVLSMSDRASFFKAMLREVADPSL